MKEHVFSHRLDKAILFALLLSGILLSSPRCLSGQTPEIAFAQNVEESRAKMNAKYPDLNKPGTPLYEFVIVTKRLIQEKNPDLFKYSRWPEVIAESCVKNLAAYERVQAEEAQRKQAAAYQEQQDASNDRQNRALIYAEAEALRKQAQRQATRHDSGDVSGPSFNETLQSERIWEQDNRIRSLDAQLWQEKVSH